MTPQFVCCHKSFVVNLSFVKSLEGLELILTTGSRKMKAGLLAKTDTKNQ